MKVDDLLEALLLESANDAAETLAEGISGSQSAFVAAMNKRAPPARPRASTSYANPIGLDDPAQLLDARATWPSSPSDLLQQPPLRADRRHARSRSCKSGVAPAHGRATATCCRRLPVRGRRQDRPHHARRLRAGRRRARSSIGGAVISRRDGRAERGGARHRHARAAALGARRSSTASAVLDRHRPLGPPGHRVPRRSARARARRTALALTLRDGRARDGAGWRRPSRSRGPARRRARGSARSPCSVDGERVRRVPLVTADGRAQSAGPLRVAHLGPGRPLDPARGPRHPAFWSRSSCFVCACGCRRSSQR